MANGRYVNNVGSSARPKSAKGAHIFSRHYYRHFGASGDVRGEYKDLEFTSTGSGETVRLRGIANGLLCATGGTINALHATGRVAAAKTVSGALNAARFTLEVAGTTPTPGGTLAAIQLDSNMVSGTTLGNETAFVRVTESGTALVKNLFNIESTAMTDGSNSPDDHLVSTHSGATATHLIKCRVNGANMWLMACNAHT